MDTRLVDVRDVQFRIEVSEAGSGQDLLFLHGAGGAQWDPLLEGLAARYHVILPRHPGIGGSTGDEHLQDLPDLLYYYLDLLDGLNLRNLFLVGHSLGGMFAAELAALQPERFSKLVLLAPVGLWNPEHPVLDIFAAAPDELARAVYHDPESPAAKAATQIPEDGEARISYILERTKLLRVAAKYMWPIPNRGLAKRLHRVRMPTLLVWGESDGVVPVAYAADFQARLPNARVEIIPQAGHLPQLEQPDRVLDVVTKFLG